jgi:hypothetical protein
VSASFLFHSQFHSHGFSPSHFPSKLRLLQYFLNLSNTHSSLLKDHQQERVSIKQSISQGLAWAKHEMRHGTANLPMAR